MHQYEYGEVCGIVESTLQIKSVLLLCTITVSRASVKNLSNVLLK